MSDGTKNLPWYRTVAGWFSLASLLITFALTVFTWMQWHELHNQWMFSVKPHINFDTEDDPDSPPVGISISNAGPGPAIIKSLTYYVDRKPVRDYSEAMEYGKINSDIVDYFEFEADDTLAVGEKDWLTQYRKPRAAKKAGKQQDQKEQKDLDAYLDFIDYHLAVKVHYCTAMEDVCWEKCSTKDRC
jgi:hypothetical protein